jgi:Class III cytochrome C family
MKDKRNRFYLVIGCVFLLLGLCSYFYPESSPDVPIRVHYHTAGGNVLFTHDKHVEMSNLSCEDCHHELLHANQRTGCMKCHEDDGYSDEDMDHTELVDIHRHSCTSCHQTRTGKATACRSCHGKAGDGQTISCERCHEGEEMNPDDFTHDELESIEGHYCNECHQTRANPDAIHIQCDRCHQNIEEGRFLKMHSEGKEAFQCALCHFKK